MQEYRFLGVVEVDSGTLLIGDPAYLLADAELHVAGVDYAGILVAESDTFATAVGDRPVLLVQRFGGDGPFAVYGEFSDGELVRVCIDLEPIELPNDDADRTQAL